MIHLSTPAVWTVLTGLCIAGLVGCADVREPQTRDRNASLEGVASYVAPSLKGRPTASGEPYNPDALTAAHRSFPFGTRLRVTNLSNGRVVEVRVNDRGPFVTGRVIDLSVEAARRLGFIRDGVTRVRIDILERPDP